MLFTRSPGRVRHAVAVLRRLLKFESAGSHPMSPATAITGSAAAVSCGTAAPAFCHSGSAISNPAMVDATEATTARTRRMALPPQPVEHAKPIATGKWDLRARRLPANGLSHALAAVLEPAEGSPAGREALWDARPLFSEVGVLLGVLRFQMHRQRRGTCLGFGRPSQGALELAGEAVDVVEHPP
jgi:hypothetical protein